MIYLFQRAYVRSLLPPIQYANIGQIYINNVAPSQLPVDLCLQSFFFALQKNPDTLGRPNDLKPNLWTNITWISSFSINNREILVLQIILYVSQLMMRCLEESICDSRALSNSVKHKISSSALLKKNLELASTPTFWL